MIDARRGLVYLQAFEDGRALGEPDVVPIADAARRLAALRDLTLVGPGAHLLAGAAAAARGSTLAARQTSPRSADSRERAEPAARPAAALPAGARRQADAAVMLRPATRADGPALAELHAAAFDAPWPADDILRFAEDRGGFALAVEDGDGALAGFILCRLIAGEAEVLTLAVRPAARRRGIGRALLEAALAARRSRPQTAMFLEVAADNPAAVALYEGAGFETVGRRAGYYGRAERAARSTHSSCAATLNS